MMGEKGWLFFFFFKYVQEPSEGLRLFKCPELPLEACMAQHAPLHAPETNGHAGTANKCRLLLWKVFQR